MPALLARRFTLICLAIALFAMGLAMLVARSERPARWVELKGSPQSHQGGHAQ